MKKILTVISMMIILAGCKSNKEKITKRTQDRQTTQKSRKSETKKINLDSLVANNSIYLTIVHGGSNRSKEADEKLINFYKTNIDSLYDLNIKELKPARNYCGVTPSAVNALLKSFQEEKNDYEKEINRKVNLYSSCNNRNTGGLSFSYEIKDYEILQYKNKLIELITLTIRLRKELTRTTEDSNYLEMLDIDSVMTITKERYGHCN